MIIRTTVTTSKVKNLLELQWQKRDCLPFVEIKTPGRTRVELIHYSCSYTSFSDIGICNPVSVSQVFTGTDIFIIVIDLF